MRSYLGSEFKMVFDVKQANRAGFNPLAFAEEFAENIIHIHLSDHKEGFDCLPPSKGTFDFAKLFEIMKKQATRATMLLSFTGITIPSPMSLRWQCTTSRV